jgi:hypothetical protein
LKKISTISLLVLIFCSQIGYYGIGLIQQHMIKEEMEQKVLASTPESALEIIDATYHQKDINWEEEDEEFSMNGQMYDVAKVKIVNGKKLLYCLNDKREEQLIDKLDKAVKCGTDQDNNNKDGKHTVKFQWSDFIVASIEPTAIAYQAICTSYAGFSDKLVSPYTEIHSPPPRRDYIRLKQVDI